MRLVKPMQVERQIHSTWIVPASNNKKGRVAALPFLLFDEMKY
jgi:hypothetical protein